MIATISCDFPVLSVLTTATAGTVCPFRRQPLPVNFTDDVKKFLFASGVAVPVKLHPVKPPVKLPFDKTFTVEVAVSSIAPPVHVPVRAVSDAGVL